MRVDTCKIGIPKSFNVKSNGAGVMTNRKQVERETAKPACELAAAELECVSGGTKAGSHQASGVMFLTFTFKLVAVKTV
jgi:hypothetical protein